MSWAIVAIPEERDPVWKYSSEKVPHMTLLFLGEPTDEAQNDLPRIVQYIAHVAKTVAWPFGMLVDRRGTLGDQQADVLFFHKDPRGREMISHVRDYLLADPVIKTMFNSSDQFPDWLPHLTMGYPETPAKKDTRDFPEFSYVSFDRIALWTDDFSGPEFRLEGREDMVVSDMSMSDATTTFLSNFGIAADPVGAFLEHHGIKGMHWGHRKADDSNSGASNKKEKRDELGFTKKERKAETKWTKKSLSSKTYFEVHNAAARAMNDVELPRINAKNEYSGDLTKKPKLQAKYNREVGDAFVSQMNKAHKTIIGESPTGRRQFKYSMNDDGDLIYDITFKDGSDGTTKHSFEDGAVRFKVKKNSNGRAVTVSAIEDVLQQSDETVDAFLEHHGIKGMHWGVRRSDTSSGEARATQKKPGTKITTQGGKGAPAHEDAIRAAIAKQLAKSSTTDALSTKQLQDLVTRMNLEQQYSKLSSNSVSPGRKFVNDLLVKTAKEQATRIAAEQASNLISQQVKKRTGGAS